MNKGLKCLIACALTFTLSVPLAAHAANISESDNVFTQEADASSDFIDEEAAEETEAEEIENSQESSEETVSDENLTAASQNELNWYYVGKGKGNPAEPPKESAAFLDKNNGYYKADTEEKVLYLTFDEGYENGNTGKILDILKEANVPAAFFVVKPYIDKDPDLVKRMVDEGHVVGNHSVHHPSMASIHDPAKFKEEFTGVEETFKQVTGQDMPKFFRPPMGKYSESSLEMTKDLGYKTIFWSFAYKDWLINEQPDPGKAVEKITNGVYPGCIMLLHAVSDTNTQVLPQVLKQLQDEGYTFKSLNELPEHTTQQTQS